MTVPLEAPPRHSNGAHWGRFVRTIVEVEADDGLIGLGETGGGSKLPYRGGRIRVPDGPGLGVRLNSEKVRKYSALYAELGSYPYDRDPGRPDWYALVPNERWADPSVSVMPQLR